MVMILALVVGAGGGIHPANANDARPAHRNCDLVRQQPGRPAAESAADTGTALSEICRTGLPGVGPANANGLGQYIPLAVADTTTFPGSDYYLIGIQEYIERVHPNLPAARHQIPGLC